MSEVACYVLKLFCMSKPLAVAAACPAISMMWSATTSAPFNGRLHRYITRFAAIHLLQQTQSRRDTIHLVVWGGLVQVYKVPDSGLLLIQCRNSTVTVL